MNVRLLLPNYIRQTDRQTCNDLGSCVPWDRAKPAKPARTTHHLDVGARQVCPVQPQCGAKGCDLAPVPPQHLHEPAERLNVVELDLGLCAQRGKE